MRPADTGTTSNHLRIQIRIEILCLLCAEVQSELEEQRRVVNYLRSELASLEHDLHDTRQQLAVKEEQLAAKAEPDSSANDHNNLAAQLAAAQREKQELASLVDEVTRIASSCPAVCAAICHDCAHSAQELQR